MYHKLVFGKGSSKAQNESGSTVKVVHWLIYGFIIYVAKKKNYKDTFSLVNSDTVSITLLY